MKKLRQNIVYGSNVQHLRTTRFLWDLSQIAWCNNSIQSHIASIIQRQRLHSNDNQLTHSTQRTLNLEMQNYKRKKNSGNANIKNNSTFQVPVVFTVAYGTKCKCFCLAPMWRFWRTKYFNSSTLFPYSS